MRNPTKSVPIAELEIGNVVVAHGARFRVEERFFAPAKVGVIGSERDIYNVRASFIDGREEPGYFGPKKDFNFQGILGVTVAVEI